MSSTALLSVAAYACDEFTEKKSRFIGHIAPAADEVAAQAFLEQIQSRHRGARHNCYAWICGPQDSCQRSSDAGEPAGTAGRPLLEALKRAQLHDTALVVTRYFGGVLLGAGGLTRAYAKAAQLAIDAAQLVRRQPAARYALSCDYTLAARLEPWLRQQNIVIENRLYGEQVCFMAAITADAPPDWQQQLLDQCNGRVELLDLNETVMLEQV